MHFLKAEVNQPRLFATSRRTRENKNALLLGRIMGPSFDAPEDRVGRFVADWSCHTIKVCQGSNLAAN